MSDRVTQNNSMVQTIMICYYTFLIFSKTFSPSLSHYNFAQSYKMVINFLQHWGGGGEDF